MAARPRLATKHFEVLSDVAGCHGGRRLVVRRKHAWFDWSAGDGGDITTDLRIHIAILGEAAAAYFGFVQLGADTITLPDVEEVNGALDRLDRALPPRLRTQIRFYEKVEAFGDETLYATRFCDEGRLPISRAPKQFFHDIVGHSLQGLYCENELLALIGRRRRPWRLFIASPRARRLSGDERLIASELSHLVELRIGTQIDSSSNFLFNLLPVHTRRALGRDNVRLSRSKRSALATRGMPDRLMPSLDHDVSPEAFYRRLFRDYRALRGLARCSLMDDFWASSSAWPRGVDGRGLSYPLRSDFARLARALAVEDRGEREARMVEIAFASPFVQRLRRVRALAQR